MNVDAPVPAVTVCVVPPAISFPACVFPACSSPDSSCVQVLPLWLRVYQQETSECQIKRALLASHRR